MAEVQKRRSNVAQRAPGVLFSSLAAVLIVLVATAFTPAEPPPPPTAEYAPEAVKAIKTAPPEQQTNVGSAKAGQANQAAPGGKGPGGSAPTAGKSPGPSASPTPAPAAAKTSPTPGPSAVPSAPPASPAPSSSAVAPRPRPGAQAAPPPVITVANVRRCVGDPPRQIEDTQSPPCVPAYQGDPPGATSAGVDSNTVRIAVPNGSPDITDLFAFFNKRFEFYGRKLVPVSDQTCFGGGDPQSQKAKADSIAQQKVFADLGFCDAAGTEYPYYDQLAKDGVVSVANRPGVADEAHLAAHQPYEWTYLPAFDVGSSHLADLACTLKGKTASNAGAAYLTSTRKFGVISNTYADAPPPDIGPVKAILAACGIDADYQTVLLDRSGISGQGVSQESAQETSAALLDLRSKGVTTILNLVHGNTIKQLFAVASGQGYQPEQLVSTYLYGDEELGESQQPRDQVEHVFGISTYNKFNRTENEPWYRAIIEVDPTYQFTYGPASYAGARYDYHALLMIAAGIQMAGPNLTPETFAKGLQQTTFPNPDNRFHEGKVTVSPTSHSYLADATTIRWSSAQTSEYTGGGGWCYVDNGVRRNVGAYPPDENAKIVPTAACERY